MHSYEIPCILKINAGANKEYLNWIKKRLDRMFQIIKEVRDIKRFNEILVVLFEEGFDFLIGKLGLSNKIPFTSKLKPRNAKENIKPEVMLRKTLERLSTTFVKFGTSFLV